MTLAHEWQVCLGNIMEMYDNIMEYAFEFKKIHNRRLIMQRRWSLFMFIIENTTLTWVHFDSFQIEQVYNFF